MRAAGPRDNSLRHGACSRFMILGELPTRRRTDARCAIRDRTAWLIRRGRSWEEGRLPATACGASPPLPVAPRALLHKKGPTSVTRQARPVQPGARTGGLAVSGVRQTEPTLLSGPERGTLEDASREVDVLTSSGSEPLQGAMGAASLRSPTTAVRCARLSLPASMLGGPTRPCATPSSARDARRASCGHFRALSSRQSRAGRASRASRASIPCHSIPLSASSGRSNNSRSR